MYTIVFGGGEYLSVSVSEWVYTCILFGGEMEGRMCADLSASLRTNKLTKFQLTCSEDTRT